MRHKRKISDEQRQKISTTNRLVMAELKKNGAKLGSARPGHWKGRENKRGFQEATEASAIARSRRARECYKVVVDLIVEWQDEGMPLDAIAIRLNNQGFLTLAGNPFRQPAVSAVLKLFGKEPIKHSFVKDTCKKCGKVFRVPTELLPRPHVCFCCQEEK